MQRSIAKILTATPSDIKSNLEQFRRSIQQWAQELHGLKTLTEGSQISLKDYMIYGMINQIITDIKQVCQRVIEFGTKLEEPVLQYFQHQDEYRGQDQYRKRARFPSRSSPPSKRQYRNDDTTVANTLVQRPHKQHGPSCCAGTVTHSDQDCLVPGQLLLNSPLSPLTC